MLQEIQKELTEHIIPFWRGLRDDEYGGYYGLMDFDLKVDKKAEKGAILNSRILWFFSRAFNELKDISLLEEADHAYRFLKEKLAGDGTKGNPFKFGLLFSEPYGIEVYHPDHGKISFIPPNAEAGNTVTFNVRPDSGYNIKSVGYKGKVITSKILFCPLFSTN